MCSRDGFLTACIMHAKATYTIPRIVTVLCQQSDEAMAGRNYPGIDYATLATTSTKCSAPAPKIVTAVAGTRQHKPAVGKEQCRLSRAYVCRAAYVAGHDASN